MPKPASQSDLIAGLNQQAGDLKAAGRQDQAIEVLAQIVRIAPGSAVAEHNLAGALGDAGRWAEAEPHLQRAFRKGLDAPETWLVNGRCLLALARFEEAEQAFRQAIRRRSTYADAHRDLAQMRWMRSGDVAFALTDVEKALAANPGDPTLTIVKAQALEHAGDLETANTLYAGLAGRFPADAMVAAYAANGALKLGRTAEALAHAEHAARISPRETVTQTTLIEALLAAGQPERAARIADDLRRQSPLDQHAIARQATAWRMLGDPRYRQLYNYGAFVSRSMLDVPEGWPDLESYISELAPALKAVHAFREHPFNQSLRHGSQAADLLQQPHPAIRALPQALDGPIRRRLALLGRGDDPVRSRNAGNYAFKGMWSVQLHPNGYHVDHVHPQGWLSSACYVETVKENGREGWIKFGQPGIPTSPAMDAEHYERPEPGLLVLFPSYMWHGTVPFSGDQTRLTFAFDLVPADA